MALSKLRSWLVAKIVKREVDKLRKEDNVSIFSKALKFLDGWKLMIGVTAVFAVKVWDGMHNGHAGDIVGNVLNVLGWLPEDPGLTGAGMAAAVASTVTIIGYVAKLFKAQQQSKAGTPISGLLSTQGYVQTFVSTGKGYVPKPVSKFPKYLSDKQ